MSLSFSQLFDTLTALMTSMDEEWTADKQRMFNQTLCYYIAQVHHKVLDLEQCPKAFTVHES
jgi:hypothetical protein